MASNLLGKLITTDGVEIGGPAYGNTIIIKNIGAAAAALLTSAAGGVGSVSITIAATGESGDSITLINNSGFKPFVINASGTTVQVLYYSM